MPDDNQLIRFSYSAVSKWLSCRQAWSFNYAHGLVPIVSDPEPAIGSAVHFALGMAILQGTDDEVLQSALDIWFSEQMEPYEGLPEDAYESIHAVLSEHCERAAFIAKRALNAIHIEEWETIRDRTGTPMVEWHFDREVPGVGLLTGDIDWVARHRPTGLVWLFDHKIRGTLTSAPAEDFNIQMALYQHVLQEDEGLSLAGSILFQVSSHLPKTPTLTKKGEVSRAAIDTTWEVYRQYVLDAGLDPANYDEMRQKLEAKVFYRPIRYFRSREHVRAVWERIFLPAAREMREALFTPDVVGTPNPLIIRNMVPFLCRRCPYAPVCVGELRGEDVSYTVATQYARRDSSALLAGDPGDPGDEDGSQVLDT